MAFRRKRISAEQMDGFVARLMELSIQEADLTSDQMLSLPVAACSRARERVNLLRRCVPRAR
jgi:hypothetical protein